MSFSFIVDQIELNNNGQEKARKQRGSNDDIHGYEVPEDGT